MNKKVKTLPYANNALAIGITAALAVLSVFLFFERGEVTCRHIYEDAAIFGFLTFAIDMALVYPRLRKMYLAGELPENALSSKILKHMPKNPVLFGLIFGIVFALIVPAFNYVFLLFYELTSMKFWSFLFYRTVYAVVFSIWMTRIIILRYVQEGAFKGDVKQSGTQKVATAIPQIATLKEEYNSALSDFGLNMIVGLIFGGTKVGMDLGLNANEQKWLFIMPQYRSGLFISVLIYTCIVFLLAIVPVTKTIKTMCEAGELPVIKAPAFFKKLPSNPWAYACVWIVPIFCLAYLFLFVIMTVMDFEVLNFFQFWILRLLLIKLIVKLTTVLAVLRYTQNTDEAKS